VAARKASAESHQSELKALQNGHEKELGALKAGHADTLQASRATEDRLRAEFKDSFQVEAQKIFRENNSEMHEKLGLQLSPLSQSLKEMRELDKKQGEATFALKEEVNRLSEETKNLQGKSESLTSALRGSSATRGRWGEQSVERIFEIAGLTDGIHFKKQVVTESQQRPDFLVFLTEEDVIPIDSKAVFADYLQSLEANSDEERQEFLKKHGKAVKEQIKRLSSKDYHVETSGRIDWTVLYLPGAHLLDAAFEQFPDLLEYANRKRISLATPVTLLALLNTVAAHWKVRSMADNVEKLGDAAREMHSRVSTLVGHFATTGKNLQRTVEAFNKSVGSYNHNVLPQGKKLEELGASTSGKEMPEMPLIEKQTRDDLRLPEGSKA
ncbi:MAG: DNA recombination protein RmuC, partial [Planctomycetes bacterium]|nr:DNA recombination protein RmuC [Planctomycetota bacterium]